MTYKQYFRWERNIARDFARWLNRSSKAKVEASIAEARKCNYQNTLAGHKMPKMRASHKHNAYHTGLFGHI